MVRVKEVDLRGKKQPKTTFRCVLTIIAPPPNNAQYTYPIPAKRLTYLLLVLINIVYIVKALPQVILTATKLGRQDQLIDFGDSGYQAANKVHSFITNP